MMETAAVLARFTVFCMMTYGYLLLGKRWMKLDAECMPVIVFTCQGCMLFLAGILNVLPLMYLLLMAGGLLTFWDAVLRKREGLLRENPALAVIFLLCVYLLLFLSGSKYYQYDNFTHWGLVARSIWETSRFPSFEDTLVRFQAYPPGSAGFIWFVCRCIGYSEGHALFAQAMLIVSCMCPLLLFARGASGKRKWAAGAAAVWMCLIMTSYGADLANGVNNLLVDVLLAALAAAAFCIVYFYRRNKKRAAAGVLPVLIFLVCVKSSGMIWVLVITAEIVWFFLKDGMKKEACGAAACAAGLPAAVWYLWNRHVELVFAGGTATRHAVSAANYGNIFSQKSEEDIRAIAVLFLQKNFSPENKILWILLLLFIGIIFIRVSDKKLFKALDGWFMAAAGIASALLYQLGSFLMYLLSMPMEEAGRMAGYERYSMTLELFLFCMALALSLNFLRKAETKGFPAGAFFLVLLNGLFLAAFSCDLDTLYTREHPETGRESARERLEGIMQRYRLEPGKRSLIYIGDDKKDRDVGYRYFLSKYLLWSNDVAVVNREEADRLREAGQYDYVILLEPDQEARDRLYEMGLDGGLEAVRLQDYEYVKAAGYIDGLRREEYIVFFSVRDDASLSFNGEIRNAMRSLGLQYDLTGKYRCSYLAVVDGAKAVAEKAGTKRQEYSGAAEGIEYRIISAGFTAGNESSILINGEEFSPNERGINIVVYDKEKRCAVSGKTFDTWLMDGRWEKK